MAITHQYPVGQTVKMTLTCVDANGDSAEPDSIDITVVKPNLPDGTEQSNDTYAKGDLTPGATGVYTFEFQLTSVDAWVVRCETTTGTVVAVADDVVIEALHSAAYPDGYV